MEADMSEGNETEADTPVVLDKADSVSEVMKMLRDIKTSQDSMKKSIEEKLKAISTDIGKKIDSIVERMPST